MRIVPNENWAKPATVLNLAIASLIAACLGFFAARATEVRVASEGGASPESAGERSEGLASQEDLERPRSPVLGSSAQDSQAEPTQPADSSVERQAVGLFSAALEEHFGREFVAGWSSVRAAEPAQDEVTAGREAFHEGVLALPAALGKKAAERANARDELDRALEEGDGLALLEAQADGRWHPTREDLLGEVLDRALVQRATGPTVHGPELSSKEQSLTTGMVLSFGPGFHELDARDLKAEDGRSFPSDITIRGAGMDRTVLSVDGDLTADNAVERLHMSDITFDCANDYVFDLRRGPLTMSCDRVRIVRFDMGAGGSYAFSVSPGVLLRARDCEILGGYGRSPGYCNLTRGEAVGSFVRCRFAEVNLNLSEFGEAVVFVDCTFERYQRDPVAGHESLFVNPRVIPMTDEDRARSGETRSLQVFFPLWQDR